MKKYILTFLIFVIGVHFSMAQKFKFGKVSKEDLEQVACPFDSLADACILYKKRHTYFEYTEDKGFIIKEDFFFRLKIYNEEAYDSGTISIPLYFNEKKTEKVTDLKAVTYNLKNGKILRTKLDNDNIYKEKTSKHIKHIKFTMPNLKPGSVIEWKYTLVSPFFVELEPMVVQYDIPVKREEIDINIPDFFRYRLHPTGLYEFQLQKKSKVKSHRVVDADLQSDGVLLHNDYQYKENIYTLQINDVPALHKEPYVGNIENFRSSVVFELAVVAFPGKKRKDYAITWEDVAKDAYEDDDFGAQFKDTGYLDKLNKYLVGEPKDLNKLKRVFELAKQSIKWNNKYDYYVDEGVQEAFKKGSGNVAEVNINLINMLRKSGFEAFPVLVSTVQHGIPLFPTRTGFNYLIAAVSFNDKQYLLDATEPYTNLEVLPERVLNFHGRLIKNDGNSEEIILFPDKFSRSLTTVNVHLDDAELSGTSINKKSGYYAYLLRNKIAGASKEAKKSFLQKKYEDFEIKNFRFSNLKNPYSQTKEIIQFNTDIYVEEISGQIFITPLLFWKTDSNPFKSETRKFPVFFDYPHIRFTTVNIMIPPGYKPVLLPKTEIISFGDKDGVFEYKVEQLKNKIVVSSNFVISTPIVESELYQELKIFMDKVIAKQKEKIVLKKNP